MTVPSLVIITTGPFDGVAWNVVVALMLFTTGEDRLYINDGPDGHTIRM